jgi:flagellar export protein FliJ
VYRFRLQRVLDYRRRKEEECENTLRQAQLLHQQEEAQLEALKIEARAQEEQLEGSRGATLAPAELHHSQRYHQSLVQGMVAQRNVVAQAMQVVAEQRQRLLVARQETRVIEKLRDKAQQRYMLEVASREQQLLDDLALKRSRHEQ